MLSSNLPRTLAGGGSFCGVEWDADYFCGWWVQQVRHGNKVLREGRTSQVQPVKRGKVERPGTLAPGLA